MNGDVMNKGMIKSTFREIKTSFGRYMAMLLIVALGIGFFAGLKVAYRLMLDSADYYLDNHEMYDYQMISTLGFDEEAADMLSKEQGVRQSEGSKSMDVLMMGEGGNEWVVRALELPEKVNVPELTAGRMPENAGECLADEHAFSKDSIGTTLTLSDANEEETTDAFQVQAYTIVGLVRSPIYIYYQRGATSVGDGMIDGYIYLKPEAFDMDYDTSIYVMFDQNTPLYSEEYDDLISAKEDIWEQLNEQTANSRYDRIYNDARAEIADAQQTLDENKSEGEQELSDALKELEDGKSQLADGKRQIRNAKKTITENEEKLEKSEKEYKEGLKAYRKNKKEFDKGKADYQAGLSAYETGYAEYQTKKAEYDSGKAAYEESEKQYAEAMAAYEAGKAYLSEADRQAKEKELAGWRATLDATGAGLTEAGITFSAAEADFAANKAQLDKSGKEIAKGEKELSKAKKKLDEAALQIKEGKEELEKAKRQIADKERELATAEQELADGQAEYEDARGEFDEEIGKAEKELADAKKEVADIEKPDTYLLGRSSNIGYESFKNDAGIIEGVSRVFPIFFFLVAALVCMTTMMRMMEEQRTQIGVLKALGYSNGTIIGKYITYSGSAAAIGAVLGYFAGTWVFSMVIWTAYKMMYDMGSLRYLFKPGYLLMSVLAALICAGGATFISCYRELQEMAAALMRPKAPKTGKRVFLERISPLWNRLKFLDKVSIRNLFRYKKRLFMMIVGVSGCTALLVTGLGIRDSIAGIANTQFDTIFVYDLAVGLEEEESVEVDGVTDSLLVCGQSVELHSEGRTKDVNLLVPKEREDFGQYIDLHDKEGNAIAFPGEGEAVISFKIAENYDIHEGDTIHLQNSDLKGGEVTVIGIFENYFNHYVVMEPETYEALFGEQADFNEMFVNVEEDKIHEAAAAFMKQDGVTTVSISEDSKTHVSDMMKSLDYVVILVVICAALLAFIVIYNLNNINITERIREIATIKVLGFYKEETHSYVFRENMALTLLGSLVGIGLGYCLHDFVMKQINIDAVAFDVHITLLSYIISIVLTLLFNQLVNLFMSRKLEAVDMAESLKSVE